MATVEGSNGPESIVEARLETGRTHQIRAHAAHLGFPLVGDVRYGAAASNGGNDGDRLCLHAWRLEFEHPISGEPVSIESALPEWAGPTAPYR